PALAEGHAALVERHAVLAGGHTALPERHSALAERHAALVEGHPAGAEGHAPHAERHPLEVRLFHAIGHAARPHGIGRVAVGRGPHVVPAHRRNLLVRSNLLGPTPAAAPATGLPGTGRPRRRQTAGLLLDGRGLAAESSPHHVDHLTDPAYVRRPAADPKTTRFEGAVLW